MVKLIEQRLFLSWATAVIATLGSLYFSEIMHFIPCTLCWYQRILMYPMVILLTIAHWQKDYKIALYTMIFSVIGGSISIYHYAIQKVPFLHDTATKCGIVPCNEDYLNWFGFITIPLLALIAFIIIFATSFSAYRLVKRGY